MIRRFFRRLHIWALDHGWAHCEPWEDPRRSKADRALWRASQPKRLVDAGRS